MHLDVSFIVSVLWIAFFFIIFIVLNLIDVFLTRKIKKRGGIELNPIVNRFGLWKVKIGITVALIVFLVQFPRYWFAVLIPLDVVLSGACVWNVIQLRKQRRLF